MRVVNRLATVIGYFIGIINIGACNSDLPDPDSGHRIMGHITYTGSAESQMNRPALLVAAFPEFPPQGPPRASVVFFAPTLGSPLEYELKNVPPASYKIIAQILDLDDQEAMGPSGGFPSLCAVLFSPQPNVTVLEDRSVVDVNITVYDGGADPCFAPPPADAGS